MARVLVVDDAMFMRMTIRETATLLQERQEMAWRL